MKKIKQTRDKKCKLRRYVIPSDGNSNVIAAKDFTCDEVRASHEEWKKEFRDRNGTDELLSVGFKDESYEKFCNAIQDFLSQCKCKTSCQLNLKVSVGERIATAKKLRDEGKGPWENHKE